MYRDLCHHCCYVKGVEVGVQLGVRQWFKGNSLLFEIARSSTNGKNRFLFKLAYQWFKTGCLRDCSLSDFIACSNFYNKKKHRLPSSFCKCFYNVILLQCLASRTLLMWACLQGADWPHESSPDTQSPFINLKLKSWSSSTPKTSSLSAALRSSQPEKTLARGRFPVSPQTSAGTTKCRLFTQAGKQLFEPKIGSFHSVHVIP